MNDDKRKRIDALVVLVEGIRTEEKQDLEDTPNNIEHSSECDDFRFCINTLGLAIDNLRHAKR